MHTKPQEVCAREGEMGEEGLGGKGGERGGMGPAPHTKLL